MEHDEIVGRLRGLNVLVLHPRDGDAEELLQQLNRIGCRAQAIWPPPPPKVAKRTFRSTTKRTFFDEKNIAFRSSLTLVDSAFRVTM